MMAEPEAVSRGDRLRLEIAAGRGGFHGSGEKRMDPLENRLEQLSGVFPVFEKAVEHKAQARIELGLVDAAEQKIADHKGNHANERCRRRLQSRKTLERWI